MESHSTLPFVSGFYHSTSRKTVSLVDLMFLDFLAATELSCLLLLLETLFGSGLCTYSFDFVVVVVVVRMVFILLLLLFYLLNIFADCFTSIYPFKCWGTPEFSTAASSFFNLHYLPGLTLLEHGFLHRI